MVYSVQSSLHQNKNRKGQRDGIKKYVCSVKLYNKKKRVPCLNCKKDLRVCQLCVFSHWSKRSRLLKILYPRCQVISHLLILRAVCATFVLTLV